MKISILKTLLDDSVLINTVDLVLYTANKTKTISLNIDHLKSCKQNNVFGLEISDNLYNSYDSIKYEVLFKNGIKQEFDFPNKEDALFTVPKRKKEIPNTKINTKSPYYLNNDVDKAIIIHKMMSDISNIYNTSEINLGSKNLIYYSVFGGGYADLFKTSLETIKNNSVINFDVLVITDLVTEGYIKELVLPVEFNISYHIIDTPEDGIAASMAKTRIFEWDIINEYRKILFLDCDIICINDVAPIFDGVLDTNKIYTVYNPTVNTGSFLTLYHGLKYRAQDIKDKADLKGYRPFNAGQFAFLNSTYIQEHFKILNDTMVVWPGEYFAEQSFMNNYAVIADIIDQSISDRFVIGNATVVNPAKIHDDDDIFIHFTAPFLDSSVKIPFIENYMINFVQ